MVIDSIRFDTTEVTSVQYYADIDNTESLVALSLFVDCSGVAIIALEGEWLLSSSGSLLVQDLRHLFPMKLHQDSGKKDKSCQRKLLLEILRADIDKINLSSWQKK